MSLIDATQPQFKSGSGTFKAVRNHKSPFACVCSQLSHPTSQRTDLTAMNDDWQSQNAFQVKALAHVSNSFLSLDGQTGAAHYSRLTYARPALVTTATMVKTTRQL
jgi:hypothetical protein